VTTKSRPEAKVASFRVRCVEYLDQRGRPVGDLPDFAQDHDALAAMYRAMVLTRTFDEKAIALQRTGRLGTYASTLGQEAVSIGTAAAMREDDVLLPSFREHGAQLWRGVTLLELFQYWGGDERGSNFSGPRQDFPVSIPVASHIPHAAGVALAFQLRGEQRAAVAIFGDGATSKGDFYEAINLAGVWTLPAVFVVNNNQWAISVPRRAQTAARTLAQKAIAAGFDGVEVDGNDIVAVRQTVSEALEKARAGGGPTLVEALTYRMGDHTTADDAARYREDSDVAAHWKQDPIARLRTYLVAAGAWDKEREETLLRETAATVEGAVAEYEGLAQEPPAAMFDYLYDQLPPMLVNQRAAMLEAAEAEDDDG